MTTYSLQILQFTHFNTVTVWNSSASGLHYLTRLRDVKALNNVGYLVFPILETVRNKTALSLAAYNTVTHNTLAVIIYTYGS